MPKVIHEYWYDLTRQRLGYCQLEVNKETPKMFYGNALNTSGIKVGNFAVNKNNINQLVEFRNFHGIEYRVQTDIENEAAAKDMAKALIHGRIMRMADKVMTL